jgi:LPS-assembly protein
LKPFQLEWLIHALMSIPMHPRRSFPVFIAVFLAAGFALLALVSPAQAQGEKAIPLELRNPQNTVSVRADSYEKIGDAYTYKGHVEITYQTMMMTADQMTFNNVTGDVVATGHVTFTDPQAYFEAEEAHYDVQTQRGWFTDGSGYIHARVTPRARMLVTENPFYIRAQRVDRLNKGHYKVYNGRVTDCDCEKTGWSFSAKTADVTVGDKLRIHDGAFRLLRVPVFYSPYLLASIAKRKIQTGFLLPHIGNSSQKGFIVGEGFFWEINPSANLMVGLADYSKRGLARMATFNAAPSKTSQVLVDYYGVNDTGPVAVRAGGQSIHAIAKTKDLFWGFRGAMDVDYVNSLAFRLTWSDNFTQAVTSEAKQSGFLTKNFDAYSINLYTSRYQNFLSTSQAPGNSVKIWETPSFSVDGMDKQIGSTPLFYSFDASAAGLGRDEPSFATPTLSDRLDLHPEITLRSKPFGGFHVTPSVGFDAAHYGTSLRADHSSVDRVMGQFTLDIRPPSLERTFKTTFKGHRYKHVIEPDVRYTLVKATDPQNLLDVTRFDQLDLLAETNQVEYSITNTLLMRKETPDGSQDSQHARELISWRLSEIYYYDPTFGGALQPGKQVVFEPTIALTGFAFAQGRRLSPIVSDFKFEPFSNFDTEIRTDLDPRGGVLNAGITSQVHTGPVGIAFTDFFINRTAALLTPLPPSVSPMQLPSFHLFRTIATYGRSNQKGFSGAFGIDYNLAQRIAQQVVAQTSYNFGCFGIGLEYRRFSLGPLRQENLFRIALSLSNIGTFGNLKPRERLY